MRWKLFVEFCLTTIILFIIAGDIFLPQPYRAESQQVRTNINQFIARLLPNKPIIEIQSEEKDPIQITK